MEIIKIVCMFVLLGFMATLTFVILDEKMRKKRMPKIVADYNDLMDILDKTIGRELHQKFNLQYSSKEFKNIYDPKYEISNLTSNVMQAVSEDFLGALEKYHTREYIIIYISRTIESYVFTFMNENKYSNNISS